MQYYPNPPMTGEDYIRSFHANNYRKKLRKTSNGLGFLLIAFIGMNLIISIGIIFITSSTNLGAFTEDSMLEWLTNGVVSSVTFFLIGLVYCFITGRSFARLFPFDKIGAAELSKLCVIGLSFNLFSNLVVSLVNGTFSLFGLENKGGNIDAGSSPDSLLMILTVAVLPAFVEEFAFRGVIMGTLRPYSEGVAILASSAAFALMHGNFVQMPFTFCCGLVFAFIDIKTNSLLPSIIIHFLNNGLSVLADIGLAYGIVDEAGANLIYGIIIVITGVLSFIFIKGFIKEKGSDYFTLEQGSDLIPFKAKIAAVAGSPAMISFAVIMALFSIAELFT